MALRERIPMRHRRRLALARVRVRQASARWRPLPSLVVIGAQRAGTSTLHRALGRLPTHAPPMRKETDYFTLHEHRGEGWYRAHFSLRSDRIAYEACPQYFAVPAVAPRLRRTLPEARLLLLLRDPVARARSHYLHLRAIGLEDRSFGDAIAHEADAIAAAGGVHAHIERSTSGTEPLRRYLRHSYLARSMYGSLLEAWRPDLASGRLNVVDFDDLFDPIDGGALAALELWLGAPTGALDLGRRAGTRTDAGSSELVLPAAAASLLRDDAASLRQALPTIGRRWTHSAS